MNLTRFPSNAYQRLLRQAPRTSTTTKMVQLLQPSPLAISEILERILSYLSYRKRIVVTSLVCKEWLAISRDLCGYPFQPPTSLPDLATMEHNDVLPALLSARTLTIGANNSESDPEKSTRWAQLMKTLAGNDFMRLREVNVSGSSVFCSHVIPLLSILPSLSILHLDRTGLRSWAELRELFKSCPNLKELYFEPGKGTPFPQSPMPINPLPTLTHMRILDIQDFILLEGSIESLVDACPKLEQLRVVRARAASSYEFQPSVFFSHLSKSCPRLSRLHFTVDGYRYRDEDLRALFDVEFPTINEWSFSDEELRAFPTAMGLHLLTWHALVQLNQTPLALGANIFHRDNFLTRLEFTGDRTLRLSTDAARVLHTFLCHSPHLLHLIAPNLAIYTESLDVNGTIDELCLNNLARKQLLQPPSQPNLFSSTYPSTCVSPSSKDATVADSTVKAIWACRRLQTLHIGFDSHSCTYDLCTLIVFGYLGRVCPQLQDLSIRQATMDGVGQVLCLLSRLRHLEKLDLDCETFSAFCLKDLEWMRRHSKTNPGFSLFQSRRTPSQEDHPLEDVIDMRLVGRLYDLTELKRERKCEIERGTPCWPCLDSFRLRYRREPFWGNIPDIQSLRTDARVEVVKQPSPFTMLLV